MDLKYNLAWAWLLRDRSTLPVTTLEAIKDSSETVTPVCSHSLFSSVPFQMDEKGHVLSWILNILFAICFFLENYCIYI